MGEQLDNLQAALGYAGVGWHVFPVWGAENGRCRCGRSECTAPGKHPHRLAAKGQNDATTDPGTIRAWWKADPGAGIAVFLRASGLVAIDIDPRNGGYETIDALEAEHGPLVADVVQYTQGGGEHRVFALPPDENIHLPGTLGPGVDVKRNGYIVVAPTKGVAGEYAWEASSDPLEGVSPSPLPDWIVALGHRSQPTGEAHRGATEEQVEEIRDALTHIPADDYDVWVRVGMALATLGGAGFRLWDEWSQTSQKYKASEMPRKWRSFRGSGVNLETIYFLAQQNGWRNPMAKTAVPTIVVNTPPSPQQEQPATQQLMPMPPVPVLQDIIRWMEGYSEEPNRAISIQGAIAVASVLAGRIYESENGNVSSLYLLTIAPTGAGKGYVKTAIRRLLADAGLQGLLSGAGNTSAGAVFSALFRAPTHIQITDEYGKHLLAARRQQSGAMSDALAVLTEAYSDAASMLVPRNYSHFHLSKKELAALDTKIVQRPAITILAMATPEQVYQGLTTGEIDDGFLNRMIAVDATGAQLPEQRMRVTPTPPHIIDWARTVRRVGVEFAPTNTNMTGVDQDYDVAPTPIMVPFTPEAWKVFDELKRVIRATEWPEPRLTMRWRENAMRLATALAAARQPHSPTITADLAEWAVQYVRTHGEAFMAAAVANIADSDYHRLYLAIRDAVKKAGAAGLTERELCRKSRVVERTPPHVRDQAILALMREDSVVRVKFSPQGGKGRPREALVWAEYIKERT
jgi:hypothetical protein